MKLRLYINLNEEGYIPANTECPYANRCALKRANACNHSGIHHDVEFACNIAIAFDNLEKVKLYVQK